MAEVRQQQFWADEGHNLAAFRPIHYLGSKLRIAELIRQVAFSLMPGSGAVCDLFSGSGVVSSVFAPHCPVISVDIQEYARILASAIQSSGCIGWKGLREWWNSNSSEDLAEPLRYAFEPLIQIEIDAIQAATSGKPETICQLLESGSIMANRDPSNSSCEGHINEAVREVERRLERIGKSDDKSSTVSRYFGGIYFGYEQAIQLDVYLEHASKAPKGVREVLIAATLSAASDIVNTVGKQFAQPLRPRNKDGRPKRSIWRKVSKDRSLDVSAIYGASLEKFAALPKSVKGSRAVRMDCGEFLRECTDELSLVYADPPYTRDHYSRFYHVLETMCLRDNPEISTSTEHGRRRLSRGIYRVSRHQSAFCIKSSAPMAFAELFELVAARGIPLVLSYSPFNGDERTHPRVMTTSAIKTLALEYFRSADWRSAGQLSHSKLNRTDLHLEASDEAELLLICLPN